MSGALSVVVGVLLALVGAYVRLWAPWKDDDDE